MLSAALRQTINGASMADFGKKCQLFKTSCHFEGLFFLRFRQCRYKVIYQSD